jgi:hypothetical protein
MATFGPLDEGTTAVYRLHVTNSKAAADTLRSVSNAGHGCNRNELAHGNLRRPDHR